MLCEDVLLCADAFANYSSIGTVMAKKTFRTVPYNLWSVPSEKKYPCVPINSFLKFII